MVITQPRQTAGERRTQVLDIAFEEFGLSGLHGTSTETIAARAGISQPYLFRLFRTKKELFLDTVELGFRRTGEAMLAAADLGHPDDRLDAMGDAYFRLLETDRRLLRLQMQAYAACDDPDVREVVRGEFGRLVEALEAASGVDTETLRDFLARGMLLNVMASMDLMGHPAGWAARLTESCRGS